MPKLHPNPDILADGLFLNNTHLTADYYIILKIIQPYSNTSFQSLHALTSRHIFELILFFTEFYFLAGSRLAGCCSKIRAEKTFG